MGQTSFDHIAANYDASFTETIIGRLQRKQCWNYLEKIIPQLSGSEILELNCGTGDDSITFGRKGFQIIATDISMEMLRMAETKIVKAAMQEKIELKAIDLSTFDETFLNKKFDLIFSNFGGINCIEPIALQRLLKKLALSLNPGGRLIAVIMPRFCVWESIYFLLKLRWSSAFRRWTSKKVTASLGNTSIETWYYNPGFVKKILPHNMRIVGCRPIGFFLPPSYLEKFFSTRPGALKQLNKLEEKTESFSKLSRFADHYLIDIRLI